VPVRVRVYDGEGAVSTIARTPSADPSLGIRAVPPSADPCDAARPDIAGCTPVASVRVRDLEREPNCYYDTKVTEGEVGRLMQCPGGQMIVFERATFAGPNANGFVNTCTTSTYDLPQGDACTWRTEQRIFGELRRPAFGGSAEGPTSGPLTFSYVESPVAGRDCTLACRQHAVLDVTWPDASRRGLP